VAVVCAAEPFKDTVTAVTPETTPEMVSAGLALVTAADVELV
jgi:hypothetical protein